MQQLHLLSKHLQRCARTRPQTTVSQCTCGAAYALPCTTLLCATIDAFDVLMVSHICTNELTRMSTLIGGSLVHWFHVSVFRS